MDRWQRERVWKAAMDESLSIDDKPLRWKCKMGSQGAKVVMTDRNGVTHQFAVDVGGIVRNPG